jgi:hypothetical protein
LANLGGLPKVVAGSQKKEMKKELIKFLIIIISWHPCKNQFPPLPLANLGGLPKVRL